MGFSVNIDAVGLMYSGGGEEVGSVGDDGMVCVLFELLGAAKGVDPEVLEDLSAL